MNRAMWEYIAAHQPCTTQQVAEALGRTRQAVVHRHRMGEIHISHWARDPRHNRFVAGYSLGAGPDVEPPRKARQIRVATRWVGGKYPGVRNE